MAVSTSTMQANVLKILGMNSEDTTLLARALEWLNEALDDVQLYLPEAEFLQTSEMPLTLVIDQATYALPSDFFQLLQVRNDTESVILNILTREQFDRNHPDPSSEDSATPSDLTLEYDRTNNRNIIRLAPAPVAADVFYAIMRRWHPALSSSQTIQWDKLQRILERRAVYYGSMEVFDIEQPGQAAMVDKFGMLSLNKLQAMQQIVSMQKPKPRQIPLVLRKSDY